MIQRTMRQNEHDRTRENKREAEEEGNRRRRSRKSSSSVKMKQNQKENRKVGRRKQQKKKKQDSSIPVPLVAAETRMWSSTGLHATSDAVKLRLSLLSKPAAEFFKLTCSSKRSSRIL